MDKNKYSIDVYYKPEELLILGRQKLLYKNTEDVALRDIYFYLYPNCYKWESMVPAQENINAYYPGGFNAGQIDIISATADGKEVNFSFEEYNDTLLHIKLLKPLEIGNSVEITINFQEKLPNSRTDFGSFNFVSCFENWYPVLCVYDDGLWHKEEIGGIGESNFSDICDYVVKIDLPSDEVVASSGKCIKEEESSDGRKTITIEAKNVRDFVWISSSRFKIVEKESNGVLIKSYFLDEDKVKGIEALNYADRALSYFSQSFGQYPYDTFSVVETYLYGGAMEYPMLAAVGEEHYANSDGKSLEGAVAHEVAHQWWYASVGNDEHKEPWLDEAMASYSEAMYFENYYGSKIMNEKINSDVGLAEFERSPGDSIDKFKSSNEYNLVVYMKGSYILHQFRERVGDTKFLEVMKKYYETYEFKNASIDGFIDIVKSVCGSKDAEFIKLKLSGIQ